MNPVNLADTEAHLSELVAQAASGETVCITRRGKPVAWPTALHTRRCPVPLAALRTLIDSMPVQTKTTSDFVRKMRDGDRY
jgi:antitoxin (DNA-binding transcriptional repressor) of toxin-antitoxin stability system